MRKEVIIAIVVGLVLGLIITYGVYRARVSLQPGGGAGNQPTASTTPNQADQASPDPNADSSLSISSPLDESVLSDNQITVAGNTDPEAFVAITTLDQQLLTQADATGSFSVELVLRSGANVITLHTINEDGVTASQERTVIYRTEPIEADTDTTEEEDTATETETEDQETEE